MDEQDRLTLAPGVVGVRVTESYNPADVYVCPNGHLAYNLTEDARADCRRRNVIPPPAVYDGAPCPQCAEALLQLETDVALLQHRVSNYMRMAARMKAQEPGFLAVNKDRNELALYMRGAYAYEIENGEPQHSGALSRAAIYYLQRERRRPSVVFGKLRRALLRLWGA